MSVRKDRGVMEARSVVILRALQLGDMLCAVPAFRALRQSLPKAHIALVGLPWAEAFVDRFSCYLDEFIRFPGYPVLPEINADIRAFPGFLSSVQARRFDLALQLHGSGCHVNSIIRLFGARQSAGFYLRNEYCPNPGTFLPYPNDGHEIERLVSLLKFTGIQPAGFDLEFPISVPEEQYYAAFAHATGLERDGFVCIHPGSRAKERRWCESHFAHVADELIEAGHRVVFTGVKEEQELIERCMEAMRHEAMNATGVTPLGVLASLIRHSKLLIANDTGVSHIAAAVRTPSIILFSASDPLRWAPLDSSRHRVMQATEATPRAVAEKALRMLDQGVAHAA